MNKKIVLAQVAAIYIATIGVGSAAPPDIGPVPVETVPGNPLEVTVVGSASPAVMIPAQGTSSCHIAMGAPTCSIDDLIADDSFPEGTDTFVYRSFSVDLFNDEGFATLGTYYYVRVHAEGDIHEISYMLNGELKSNANGTRAIGHELVDFQQSLGQATRVRMTVTHFSEREDVDNVGTISWSGYFTKQH